ncbi:hypothetical protein D6C84_03166 [Aureobasidium pullulans]|uniref:Uncharacterized protein n=1 Tax=Aureobasidium pullulans TaxID=5580 RepID=A0A4T0ACY6_AURPU|nr:hypothetical protein D6C84_03166 [Aureobasidium pullulans]TIA16374.1 hypothetical protein D6C80_04576 [Aureobasidium pullulans]
MRFWKDHPKEIQPDPDFPPWKGKSTAPPVTAASLALPSEIAARTPPASRDEHKPVSTVSLSPDWQAGCLFLLVWHCPSNGGPNYCEIQTIYSSTGIQVHYLTVVKKHRGFWKKALGLGSTTPPPPDSYLYDPRAERFQKMRAEAKKLRRPKDTGRVFDCRGKEITGQIPSRPASFVPKFNRSDFPPSRPPRAEPTRQDFQVRAGVGGSAGGSATPKREELACLYEHRREVDSSVVQKTPR